MNSATVEKFPMVESLIFDLQEENALYSVFSTDRLVAVLDREFRMHGAYTFCRIHGRLVNNSAEEFAIQWMSFYNEIHPGTY